MQASELTPTYFATPVEFRGWLAKHHDSETELWVGFYKKATGRPTISYAEAVDEALCYGWIDGLKHKHDELSYKLRFTPRKPKSLWSATNVANVERLVREGRMTPAGLAKVEAAKADGRWQAAYQGASTATIPDDLQQLLDANPKAKVFFGTLNATNRYVFLFRLMTAVKPATRAKRLQQTIELLNNGQVIHQL